LTLWAVRLFVASDALTFAALLLGYVYLRAHQPEWPKPFALLPGLVLTAILLASSLAMARASKSERLGDRPSAKRWLAGTLVCGLAFLALHSAEWHHLLETQHVSLTANPWGVPLFGATFFTLTGLHMAHVAAGVVAIAWTGRRPNPTGLQAANLYWQFVDAVWLFLFPAVYLTALKP
jgi:cytochrome c oxidase subunit III